MKEELKIFLKELRIYGKKNNIPNVTDVVGKFLNMMIQLHRPKTILEIGSANAYSTIWMAEAAKKINAQIHSIDHSAPTYAEAEENIKLSGFSDCVNLHFGDACDVIDQMPSSLFFDFVFVDGEKASYLDFWKAISNRLNKGAFVVFDDMLAFQHKTQSFYDFIQLDSSVDTLIIPIDEGDGILILIQH